MSELVKTMAEGDKEENEIPLPNVKSAVLQKVVQYMEYHHTSAPKEIEKPLRSANMSEVVSQWDAEFVEVEQESKCRRDCALLSLTHDIARAH